MDEYQQSRFGDRGDEEEAKDLRKHKPLSKLSESTVQNIKHIEDQVKSRSGQGEKRVDLKEYLNDEQKRALLERTKQLYAKLPKDREGVLKAELSWPSLFRHDVLEKVGRPWIGKKIKDYMGVEETSVVRMILKLLSDKPTPASLRDKLKDILDEKTDEFVMKLWQTLLFENMKIDEGLY